MPFILLAIIAIIIGTATIVESFTGTQFAHDNIYGALWMKILWGIMAIASIWQIIKRKLWSRFGIFLLHASFLIILTGALLTSLFAERGNMHLREGFAESAFTDKSNKVIRLPFLVQLDSFAIEHYPGTNVPSDYISHISIQSTDSKEYVSGKISLNNILKHNGHRFYLTSFDEDGKGTWLIVNHDPWGIATTYSGYLLFMLSAISTLFSRKGKLTSTLKQALRSKYFIGILSAAILILI
ncbi:MAG: cytochrome c biogenesis protein ResB, partial [Bacteroidaceae bacterium]|nr:cytochrome c biogenesis protein ResB [Bacteroidaceae bacterium]